MRAKLLILFMVASTSMTFAQDTTWVQTFTFDSISARRGDFTFPAELNNKRFEKVLMYYRLKCSPLTPWDQYDCGEWDYLAYTRIFDHTGDMDSVQVDSVQFLNNYQSSSLYNYDPFTGNRIDTYVRNEQMRTGATTGTSQILTSAASSNLPFDLSNNGGRVQILMTAAELISAGITPGDLQSLSLFVPTGGVTMNGDLNYPSISLKETTDTDITSFHSTGFTEVYNLTHGSLGTAPAFADGENELLFYQPFAWNGTDNIVIEFQFERSVPAVNSLTFENESTTGNLGVNYSGKNGVLNFTGSEHALFELSDIEIGSDITIAFWAKGTGNSGVNTSVLEGYDSLNNRVINIHFPWSNNRMYWDIGEGNGYDRIDKAATAGEIDNEWHHWAFVKNQGTGELKMFKDGALWHSGTGFTREVGNLHRLVIGSNRNLANNWKGKIDEFQLFSAPVDDATIAAWYNQRTTAAHPNWADLQVYYNFDENEWATDLSGNDLLLMPSTTGLFDFSEYPQVGIETGIDRPQVAFGQGTIAGTATPVEAAWLEIKEPEVVFEFAQVNHHFEIVNAFLATPDASEDVYDATNTVVASVPFTGVETYSNTGITYYQAPFEIVHDVEIGRFITPYGKQFDLGTNGFEWIYDVTDYQMYLKDVVDLAAHNTQELIDLRFAFIEGVPPRDVHSRQPIWNEWRSYSYSSLDNDVNLISTSIDLADSSRMFKIKTRFTGHGHNGNVNCCEWDSKDHMIIVDGIQRFTWEIWEETACGDNPNISQGGTWPYAREGWCPGDLVKEYDHDLTPWVTPGTTVQLDYDIEDIPSNDQAQGNGNYVAALDLISYSAPNFQNDAAIIDILNPNSWEYYGKWNPSCQNPRVILQNTGEQDLTSCTIKIWVSYGNFIEYDWTGSLGFLDKEVVEIPVTDPGAFWTGSSGVQTFTAQVWNIENDPALDEYPHNNVKTAKFDSPESIFGAFYVQFQTNNKAFENKWRLEDSDGNMIFERTSLSNSTLYRDTFDLAPGCYSVIIEDNDNDGIGFWYSAQVEGETTGTFRLRLVGGTWIEFFPADFGNFHRYNFSVGFTVNTEEQELDHEIVIFPNPNSGSFDIELSGYVGNEAELQIYDLMGREVIREKMNAQSNFASSKVELLDAPAGHYVIKIVTATGVYTEEFVIQ
ncbi:MAG: T9SS type A sorting domain-containing protein [Crocinitomicaceae bacterium]|nr:T9SS type A sorting domain-containing protein [Flavobacteriales bacterium]NQZ35406.1 T9SS type A sorting domain-containing protein [Crocinitomicaceae bacterium]